MPSKSIPKEKKENDGGGWRGIAKQTAIGYFSQVSTAGHCNEPSITKWSAQDPKAFAGGTVPKCSGSNIFRRTHFSASLDIHTVRNIYPSVSSRPNFPLSATPSTYPLTQTLFPFMLNNVFNYKSHGVREWKKWKIRESTKKKWKLSIVSPPKPDR